MALVRFFSLNCVIDRNAHFSDDFDWLFFFSDWLWHYTFWFVIVGFLFWGGFGPKLGNVWGEEQNSGALSVKPCAMSDALAVS